MRTFPPGIESFEEWFEGSKVTDSNGEPLIAFHGTQKQFEQFNTPAWFTPSEFHADAFSADWGDEGERTSQSKVIAVYLSFKNPLYTNDWAMTEPSNTDEWLAELLKSGYDSVIFSREGEVEFIALHSNQILRADHPLAPDGQYKNYTGTDEGRKFEGKQQPAANDLYFSKLSPWISLDCGLVVRSIHGTDARDENNQVAIIGEQAQVLINGKWNKLEMDPDLDVSSMMSKCDDYTRFHGAVLGDQLVENKTKKPSLRR